MSYIGDPLSPSKVRQKFEEAYGCNHIFMKQETLKKSKRFLSKLAEIEGKIDEKERFYLQYDMSKLTIDLWAEMLHDALDGLDEADRFDHPDTPYGIRKLKKFLKNFRKIELLFYGSNKWYRDSIYHLLWFYFVGEYIFREYGIMNDLIENNPWFCDPPHCEGPNIEDINKARYASFCVIALCHDLGKPLEKIQGINNSINEMLEQYKFLQFSPFKIEFPLTYASMIENMLKRISQTGRPLKLKNGNFHLKLLGGLREKELLRHEEIYYINFTTDYQELSHTRAKYSSALAELDHGVLSCLLLVENFNRFQGSDQYQNWKTKKEENEGKGWWVQKSYMTSQYILKPIGYHNLKVNITTETGLIYFWVYLIDELIEWYRPTRAGTDVISPSLCEVYINEMTLDRIHIRYSFLEKDEDDLLGLIDFFLKRMEKFFFQLASRSFFQIDVYNQEVELQFKYFRDGHEKEVSISGKKDGTIVFFLDKKEICKLLALEIEVQKKEIIKKLNLNE